ncbi:MAG: AAA family ATPase [Bulleidia sp.]
MQNEKDSIKTDNFCELIDEKGYFVDKSALISAVIPEKLMLITRPRRFGETLNMSMLYYFFSISERKCFCFHFCIHENSYI